MSNIKQLSGWELIIVAISLAIANFIVILDVTIVNVAIPSIAGSLSVSLSEGTYLITSYGVAEAITVPLTGWLANRFGTVRVFIYCVVLFAISSVLCGLSVNLEMLVASRILQGLVGGPIMPLSQTLLIKIFPANKQGAAMGLWGMTTLLAPIAGPILGGYLCDNWGWSVIFMVNIPIALIGAAIMSPILKPFETKITRDKIDYIGLLLLVLWVVSLQICLDKGEDNDWFTSSFIVMLAVIFVISFISFIIWELTEKCPIINLRIFVNRGFTISVVVLSLGIGTFYGSIILLPLWLQYIMNYTATWSGHVSMFLGILAVLMAPIVAKLSGTTDRRLLVFFGLIWMCVMTFWRSYNTTDMTYYDITLPLLVQGIGIPFFFIPLSALALAYVKEHEIAFAAGIMNFLRTLSGAIATSITVTSWNNAASVFRTDVVGSINAPYYGGGYIADKIPSLLDYILEQQALTIATNQLFFGMGILFILAAAIIWLAPKGNLGIRK